MNAYKQIFNILFGRFKAECTKDHLLNVLRVTYTIALLPALIFVVLLGAKSGFGEEHGKIGITKKVLLHISMIFWSLVGWITLIQIIEGKFS